MKAKLSHLGGRITCGRSREVSDVQRWLSVEVRLCESGLVMDEVFVKSKETSKC